MAPTPHLEIDLSVIRDNFRRLSAELAPLGIGVMGVNKVFDGDARTAGAVLAAGIPIIAESKAGNLARLRHLPGRKALLRSPGPGEARLAVRDADIIAACERETLRALSREALRAGRELSILLMADMGDLREGLWFEDKDGLRAALDDILALPGLNLYGFGANYGCYGTILATEENAGAFVDLAEALERDAGIRFPVLSGGNGSSYPLAVAGKLPARINELRIGGLTLFGIEYVSRQYLPAYRHSTMGVERFASDAYLLRAEVIEARPKPTVPVGIKDVDAFMQVKTFEDRGVRRAALLALGRQEVPWENIHPVDPAVRILGQTSNHTILDVEEAAKEVKAGDLLTFEVDYTGLMHLCANRGVSKKYRP